MQAVLQGNIITPIITKKTSFHLEGCRFTITRPRRRYINKIKVGQRMYPYSLIGYVGEIEVRYTCRTKTQARRKLDKLITIKRLGRLKGEGMGRIKWLKARIEPGNYKSRRPRKTVRIRKGLPHNLSQEAQDLIRYALLHDFFTTSKHRSKIYVEPELDDEELMDSLRQHHEQTDNPLIQKFQKYDQLAAIITRKVRSPRNNRYNWRAKEMIDFEQLAKEIAEVTKQSVWKLYEYIYKNKKLDLLNESMEHGHTSLRRHILLITNLVVRDIQRNNL
ncbi:MAG: hypothetical protein ACFFC7_02615 [Candidatus Hermodarchaeota archaeon]